MTKAMLTTATEEHECSGRSCPKGKKIAVGERVVKTPPTGLSVKPHYYHADTCWPQGRGRK
jgi:hypothetical protein